MAEALSLKEEGNRLFKEGNFGEAASYYTKALAVKDIPATDKSVFLKNRAACFLKIDKNLEAAADCSAALDINGGDAKALFRRCQALEALGRHEDAYKDAQKLVQIEPKNTAIQPILHRLYCVIQNKYDKHMSTDNKVTQMFDLAFDGSSDDKEKRKQAANNLIVLAREQAGAEKIFNQGGVPRLLRLLETEKDRQLQLTAIRVLASLAHENHDRAISIIESLAMKKVLAYIGSEDDELSTAMTNVLQNIINSITGLERIKRDREKHEQQRKADPASRLRPFPFLCDKIEKVAAETIDTWLNPLIQMLSSRKVSACGRDNLMELLIKFVTRKDGVGWSVKFIKAEGVQQLLTVAGTVTEHKTLSVTDQSRMHVALCLSKIYDDLNSDQERDLFQEATEAYFNDLFRDDMLESKLEAVMALTALLQGPVKAGNAVLSKEGVLDMIIAMANSENAIHVKCAVEALVHSASKKEKCTGVIGQATPILKELYQSQNDHIKVRALVGLCKLSSYGGDDASFKAYADGSSHALTKACRKFMSNPSKDVDLRKWAAEGLAYLTLDAEVKEELISDTAALKSLIDLAKTPDKGILYPVASIFCNLANCYEKKEIDAEMVELAKYAKQHVPEVHEKDKEPFISERIDKLVKAGVVNALVAFNKSESESSNELLARIYAAICNKPEHRGFVVQQGGAKALIPLANEGTEGGKIKAAHALAKIAVTQNPEIAFPGQRACEVVRPLLSLLGIDKSALENYEALLGLTNLASLGDSVRQRMIKDQGFSLIEHYAYEDHEDLRRASVECICNLVQCKEILGLNSRIKRVKDLPQIHLVYNLFGENGLCQVVDMFKGENDRVKLLVLYSGIDDDERLVRAAAGALAIISHDPEICQKITTCSTQWFEILQTLIAHEKPDIQHRAVYILYSMIEADKELATKIIESTMLELLMAVSKLAEPERHAAAQLADAALTRAAEYGLIARVKDE